jgi:mono/diheme cytochrome c family protein
MNLSRRYIYLVTCVFSLFVVTATIADEATNGYETYVKFQCHQCHGHEGQGGQPGGPRIASLDYPFEAFAVRTRHTNIMPAYSSEMLGDSELRAIYEYVSSIPEPPEADEIPLLRDALDNLDKQ